jgi:hypothetical protein
MMIGLALGLGFLRDGSGFIKRSVIDHPTHASA